MKPENLNMCHKIDCVKCDYNNEKDIEKCINIALECDEIQDIDVIE